MPGLAAAWVRLGITKRVRVRTRVRAGRTLDVARRLVGGAASLVHAVVLLCDERGLLERGAWCKSSDVGSYVPSTLGLGLGLGLGFWGWG